MHTPFQRAVVTMCACVGVLPAIGAAQTALVPGNLAVRTYDMSELLAFDRTRAIDTARRILADAGIDVRWSECSARTSAAQGPCAAPPASGELVVRLLRDTGKADAATAHALGYSLIDLTGAGSLATIYVDRVEAMAARAGAERGDVLGRAIAHEIGHLVLGPRHTPSGLMRERWTIREMARNRQRDWTFAPADRPRLQAALTARTRATAPRS